jgi:cytochrome b pre-mRNA-processing protein 3
VGKRIKNMAQAFYGRLNAYENGMVTPEQLCDAIWQNLYRGNEKTSNTQLSMVADYMYRNREHLASQPVGEILAGRGRFID